MGNKQYSLDESKAYRLVSDFFADVERELKYINRFSNKKLDALVEILTSESSNTNILSKAKLIKRARIYKESDAIERYLHPTNAPFYGYNKEESYVNLKGAGEGRCQPKYIPYLYAADTDVCCIAEVNPAIGSIVSVADIWVNQELSILNLSKSYAISNKKGSLVDDIPDCEVILHLQHLFSRPHHSDDDYFLTQYISEKIKNAGFDGLSFNSSKYAYQDSLEILRYGCNYVVFNHAKCEAISSILYRIETMPYGFRKQQIF